MKREITIHGRAVGVGQPPYVIAELSGNHNGDIERAFALIDVAKAAGADAVKLQTYTPDTMTIDSSRPDFQIKGGPWDGRALYELYGEAQTPWDWHERLFERARAKGLDCFSTPFDETAVDFLESLKSPIHKIASFELVDIALIEYIARTGKPIIMSTGMGSVDEVDEAVAAATQAGAKDVILLHCISAYPAPTSEANLFRIKMLADRYGCSVGLSDHTMGPEAAIAAVALGASVIEKHITLARSDGGPDAAFSLEPAEFGGLVLSVKNAFSALGTGGPWRPKSEEQSMVFRRSLYIVQDIEAGEKLTTANVRSIRPGYGLLPKHLPEILGRKAKQRIERGTALSWDLIA